MAKDNHNGSYSNKFESCNSELYNSMGIREFKGSFHRVLPPGIND